MSLLHNKIDKQTLGYMENLKKYLDKRVLLMIKNK